MDNLEFKISRLFGSYDDWHPLQGPEIGSLKNNEILENS